MRNTNALSFVARETSSARPLMLLELEHGQRPNNLILYGPAVFHTNCTVYNTKSGPSKSSITTYTHKTTPNPGLVNPAITTYKNISILAFLRTKAINR
jgi:hypothetical protein